MGTKWSPDKLKNHRGMLGKTHGPAARAAISAAQKVREHHGNEGFQPGHKAYAGTEATRFPKGFTPWNKGTGIGLEPAKRKLATYRSNAKKRGLPFEVTIEAMRAMLEASCAYCGGQSTGIDRIDNSLGYIEGNMAPCCGICNHMKWILSVDEFREQCRKVANLGEEYA